MPTGETTEEHKKWQEEEAALVERDRSISGPKGGLFRGCFRSRRKGFPIIRDDEDGVDRCPRCTWEMEDGACGSCGYPSGEDSAGMSDSYDEGPDLWRDEFYDMDVHPDELYDMEELEIRGLLDDDPAVVRGLMSNFDASEHGYSSGDGSFDGLGPRIRRRFRASDSTAPMNSRSHSNTEPPYDSFLDETDEDSEEEDVSSLDGFIVNDVDSRPHSEASSTRSVHWETDEDTGVEDMLAQNSNDDINSQADPDSEENEASIATVRCSLEDDSDEGPILPSRRQLPQRLLQSDRSSGGELSMAMAAVRNRGGHNDGQRQRSMTPRNPSTGGRRSRGVSFDIESDSDAPIPLQRPRRRRPIQASVLDEYDSGAASSGTATVGRQSPILVPDRNLRTQAPNQPNSTFSPILVSSSPTSNNSQPMAIANGAAEAAAREQDDRVRTGFKRSRGSDDESSTIGENTHLTVPGAFPESSQSAMPITSPPCSSNPLRDTPTHINRGAHRSPRSVLTARRPIANALPSAGIPRRSSLNRRQHHSPASRVSRSPTGEELFEMGRRDRQAQKAERRAERRRRKAEREQRKRTQSGLSPSPGPS